MVHPLRDVGHDLLAVAPCCEIVPAVLTVNLSDCCACVVAVLGLCLLEYRVGLAPDDPAELREVPVVVYQQLVEEVVHEHTASVRLHVSAYERRQLIGDRLYAFCGALRRFQRGAYVHGLGEAAYHLRVFLDEGTSATLAVRRDIVRCGVADVVVVLLANGAAYNISAHEQIPPVVERIRLGL